jgi:hypothetical protein
MLTDAVNRQKPLNKIKHISNVICEGEIMKCKRGESSTVEESI